jgi:hypothetical protein
MRRIDATPPTVTEAPDSVAPVTVKGLWLVISTALRTITDRLLSWATGKVV